MERGKRVCVLSRGYGGTLEGESHIVSNGKELLCTAAEAGDEPVLLATIVPGLMVVIGSDRYRAGLLAQEQLNLDIFILDDGFQHLRLTRDLNILLLDCQRPFGNGLTLPAGSLREPRSALSRADLVIFTRCQGEVTPACSSIAPALHSRHLLTGLSTLGSSELLPFSTLAGQRGLAFAGIADPSSFATALAAQGVELAGVFPLPDHVKYDDAVIKSLLDEQKRCGADFLITTEKDLVKLRPYGHLLPQLYAARLELELFHKGLLIGALEKLLSN
jgi:tetraacyldisaccharide 4'-kinase